MGVCVSTTETSEMLTLPMQVFVDEAMGGTEVLEGDGTEELEGDGTAGISTDRFSGLVGERGPAGVDLSAVTVSSLLDVVSSTPVKHVISGVATIS